MWKKVLNHILEPQISGSVLILPMILRASLSLRSVSQIIQWKWLFLSVCRKADTTGFWTALLSPMWNMLSTIFIYADIGGCALYVLLAKNERIFSTVQAYHKKKINSPFKIIFFKRTCYSECCIISISISSHNVDSSKKLLLIRIIFVFL